MYDLPMLWATKQDVVKQMNKLTFSILMSIFAVSSGSREFQSRKYSHKGWLLSRGQRAISRHVDSVDYSSQGHSFIHLSTNIKLLHFIYIYRLKVPNATIMEPSRGTVTLINFCGNSISFDHLSAWRVKRGYRMLSNHTLYKSPEHFWSPGHF